MASFTVSSELHAFVLTVEVEVGERVEAGTTLVVLESMKTEIPVASPRAGVIAEILVEETQQVRERQPLVVLTD